MITRLNVERFAPAAVTAMAGLIWWWLAKSIPAFYAKELLAALLSASAISAGFMTTALTILLPMVDSPIGRRLRRLDKLDLLFGYLRSAIYSSLLLAAVCVVGFFLLDEQGGLNRSASTAVIAAAVFAVAALARILEILIKIFTAMAEPEDRNG